MDSIGSEYCARVDSHGHGYKATDFKFTDLFKCSSYTIT